MPRYVYEVIRSIYHDSKAIDSCKEPSRLFKLVEWLEIAVNGMDAKETIAGVVEHFGEAMYTLGMLRERWSNECPADADIDRKIKEISDAIELFAKHKIFSLEKFV